jgi:transposase-like protein
MRKNQKYSRAEMYSAIEQCSNEDITYSHYCNQTGIPYATFKYWIKKYQRERTTRETTTKASFVPVHVQSENNTTDRFTITFPGGVRIDCPSTTPVGYLSALIKAQ